MGKKEKKEKKTGGWAGTMLLILLFLAGFAILLYPAVSSWINEQQSNAVVGQYAEKLTSLSKEQIETEWEKAVTYNEHLAGDPVKDPFVPGSGRALPENYMEVLNIDGVMGYVEIPKIKVNLPIYHGVSEEVLQKGIGHIESTALPIGSKGGHPVLTGHTGLPTAKLFTDLVDLEVGDYFYVHVLGKLLIYEVDQIKVIDPEDISDLVAFDDKDYVTLLTCTPYGVNSHRLLVRGERSYRYSEKVYIYRDTMIYKIIFWICVVVASLLTLAAVLRERDRRNNRKKLMNQEKSSE